MWKDTTVQRIRTHCVHVASFSKSKLESPYYCCRRQHTNLDGVPVVPSFFDRVKPVTDEQVFYDKFLCDKFYLLVCTRNFDIFFYDKCSCSKASMLAF